MGDNHYGRLQVGTPEFWVPASPLVRYEVGKGLDAARENVLARILTLTMAPIMIVAFKLSGMRIHALPDKDWKILIDAPELPSFLPSARRFEGDDKKDDDGQFDQAFDAPGESRDPGRARDSLEPYAGDRPIPQEMRGANGSASDAAKGDAGSEASMRYQDHARLRMQARREGMAKKTDKHVDGEDDPAKASPEYTIWREEKIKTYLTANIDTHATDHSTIMTNGMHAQKALAYDVAIGLCYIRDEDMQQFRIAADWRRLEGLDKSDPNKKFQEYIDWGLFSEVALDKWVRDSKCEARMPDKIVDKREHQPLSPHAQDRMNRGGHP